MIKPSKEFLEIFKKTDGALSVCESIAIMNIAAQANLMAGYWIELGTHKGKSCISAAYSIKESKRWFYLVDPLFEDSALAKEVIDTCEPFCTPYLVYDYSVNVIKKYEPYSYVFVDSGSHQDGLPMMEVKLLEDGMVRGGIICFHDFKSQFVEVEQAYNYLLSTGKYEEIIIDWKEIIEYVAEHDLESGNQSWHHNELAFPCFVGALKRK